MIPLKRLIFLLTILIAVCTSHVYSQDLLTGRDSGHRIFVFKLTNEEAKRIFQSNLWTVDSSYFHTLVDSYHRDSIYHENLPPGYYLKTYASKERQKIWIAAVQDFNAYIINNETDLCVQIFDLKGNVISAAEVFINKKKLKYNKDGQYFFDKKSNEKGTLTITYNGNIALYELNKSYNSPFIKRAYRKTSNSIPLKYIWKPVRFVVRLPVDGVRTAIKRYPQGVIASAKYFFRRVKNKFSVSKEYSAYDNQKAYLVFNQPIYRPGDTVRYKAFITDKNGNPLNKQAHIFLRNGSEDIPLGVLHPYRKGAYESLFVLHDSLKLKLDKQYYLYFKSEKKRTYIYHSFRLEDYELKNNKLDVRIPQTNHYRNRDFSFYIKGTDVNDLNLPDGKVEIVIRPKVYRKFFDDYTFIPDTLLKLNLPLKASGETEVIVSDSLFPPMNLEYQIDISMTTADNEVKTDRHSINYNYEDFELILKAEKDSLLVDFIRNGISEERHVKVLAFDNFNNQQVTYEGNTPVQLTLNSYYSQYMVYSDTVFKRIYLNEKSSLLNAFSQRTGKNIQIKIDNPRKIPFTYNIYRENKEKSTGRDDELLYDKNASSKKNYYISLRYLWAGKVVEENYKIPLLQNRLNITLEEPGIVSPGEQTQIGVTVTDANGRPAKDVDLTAYSLTKKFQYAAPVLSSFEKKRKGKTFINKFNIKNLTQNSIIDKALDYQKWVLLDGLDSIAYYRFTFPGDSIYSYEYPMSDSITQFAPFVMGGGKSQHIQVIYVDHRPVYLSWSNHHQMYSFPVDEGYHQIKIRTPNHEFTIDSIYFNKGMKKIFSLDTNLASLYLKKESLPDTLTAFEQNLLYRYTIPVSYNATEFNTYVFDNHNFYLLKNNYNNGKEYIGPVSGIVTYGVFNDFTRAFTHEPYYDYTVKKDLIKMRENPSSFFPKKIYPNNINFFPLKDTVITYQTAYNSWKKSKEIVGKSQKKYIAGKALHYENKGTGKISIQYESSRKDLLSQVLLNDSGKIERIFLTKTDWIGGLKENANYQLLYLFENGDYHIADSLFVKSGGVNRYRIVSPEIFQKDTGDVFLSQIEELFKTPNVDYSYIPYTQPPKIQTITKPRMTHGTREIKGVVKDLSTGEALMAANVVIKGTTNGTITDFDGEFSIYVPDDYTLEVSYLGYKTINVTSQSSFIEILLEEESSILQEVVVSASRVESRMSEMSVSINVIKSEEIQTMKGITAMPNKITLPEVSQMMTSEMVEKMLVIVNGKVFKGDIQSLEQSKIVKIQILKDEKDLKIYGPDAQNGVILITMSEADSLEEDGLSVNNSYIRSDFSDYAFWQPRLKTDKAGNASFTVKFPDDITNWATHYLAISNKKQTGQISSQIKSFKTLSGQLAVPRFLVEGDVVDVIGKAVNYQSEPVGLVTEFLVNGISTKTAPRTCESVLIDTLPVKAGKDSLEIQYSITRPDGYFDGELRKIPVFPIGLEVMKGTFEVLDKDTTIAIQPESGSGKMTIYARADALDVIKNEIVHVGNYKYFCNEQLASKLKALLAKKSINKYLNEPFTADEDIKNIIKMLEERKKENGLWGWWKDSDVTYWISNYVLEALVLAKQTGFTVNFENDKIAAGMVYNIEKDTTLDNRLTYLRILKIVGAQVDYKKYMTPLDTFTNLSLHQHLKRIELQQLVYGKADIEPIEKYRKTTLFGNAYFSESSANQWSIYGNEVQNTIRAYKILKADTSADHTAVLSKMRNFFFERRSGGRWQNIYQSAQIIETIFPDLLVNKSSLEKVKLEFSGDLNTTITQFPASMEINLSQPLEIKKTGMEPVYLTAYYHEWDKNPEIKKNDFEISTSFTDNSLKVLEAGKKVTLQVEVVMNKSAEYVMINVPIPGSCSYENKGRQQYYESHREYFRNEVAIFCEKLPAGVHFFDIELLPRYSGVFTINPAQIELMYYPVFNANNELKKISVK